MKRKLKRQRGFAKFAPEEQPKPTTFTTRPRLLNICKAYNISPETLIDSHGLGHRDLSNATLLSQDALSVIEKAFQGDKVAKDKIRGVTKVTFINPKDDSSETKRTNSVSSTSEAYKEKVLYLDTNLFSKQKNEVRYKKLSVIHSCFSDIEAINLCSKMSNPYTRNLCKQLSNPKAKKQLLTYQIHAIANKALKLFGGRILTFIYSLRNLEFKNQAAKEITTYDKIIPDFPIISFTTTDTSFKISFFLKRSKKTNQLSPDIRIYESKDYQEIGYIDEEGYVMTRLEKFRPQLNLFYEVTKSNNFKIYSGVEAGYCDLCGRELTHPTSLRIGIGPICAKKHNIDTSLYSYR